MTSHERPRNLISNAQTFHGSCHGTSLDGNKSLFCPPSVKFVTWSRSRWTLSASIERFLWLAIIEPKFSLELYFIHFHEVWERSLLKYYINCTLFEIKRTLSTSRFPSDCISFIYLVVASFLLPLVADFRDVEACWVFFSSYTWTGIGDDYNSGCWKYFLTHLGRKPHMISLLMTKNRLNIHLNITLYMFLMLPCR